MDKNGNQTTNQNQHDQYVDVMGYPVTSVTLSPNKPKLESKRTSSTSAAAALFFASGSCSNSPGYLILLFLDVPASVFHWSFGKNTLKLYVKSQHD